MSGDSTEGTTAETSSVQIDGELYHIIRRYALTLILRMGHTLVWQVKGRVYLLRCHRRIRRINDSVYPVNALYQTLRMHLV